MIHLIFLCIGNGHRMVMGNRGASVSLFFFRQCRSKVRILLISMGDHPHQRTSSINSYCSRIPELSFSRQYLRPLLGTLDQSETVSQRRLYRPPPRERYVQHHGHFQRGIVRQHRQIHERSVELRIEHYRHVAIVRRRRIRRQRRGGQGGNDRIGAVSRVELRRTESAERIHGGGVAQLAAAAAACAPRSAGAAPGERGSDAPPSHTDCHGGVSQGGRVGRHGRIAAEVGAVSTVGQLDPSFVFLTADDSADASSEVMTGEVDVSADVVVSPFVRFVLDGTGR
mmetsp:Transcript_4156/g.7975  ORF Transcript_4156/g.7975 Transcript_4156/m.7975 type:complete len:283 (+) Transcript_4156:1235-2083(+)